MYPLVAMRLEKLLLSLVHSRCYKSPTKAAIATRRSKSRSCCYLWIPECGVLFSHTSKSSIQLYRYIVLNWNEIKAKHATTLNSFFFFHFIFLRSTGTKMRTSFADLIGCISMEISRFGLQSIGCIRIESFIRNSLIIKQNMQSPQGSLNIKHQLHSLQTPCEYSDVQISEDIFILWILFFTRKLIEIFRWKNPPATKYLRFSKMWTINQWNTCKKDKEKEKWNENFAYDNFYFETSKNGKKWNKKMW